MDALQIHCQVCSRLANAQLPFYCPTCARSRVYEPRLHNARVLLEKEGLAKEVQGLFSRPDAESKDAQRRAEAGVASIEGPPQGIISAQVQRSKAAAAASQHAAAQTADEIKRLKEEMDVKRTRLKQREQALARKKEMVSARGLRAFDPLPGIARKVETDWVRLASAISEDRLFLCTEVANLYGLDLKRRVRDSKTKDIYYLGDVPIVDLRELNNAAPSLVTVSLGRIAHLLHLTSHYLALQLPAEITLPSSSNPHTLINTPLSSYKDPSLPPGQKNATTSTKATTRQRVLNLDKPLPTLAAEDQVAYSYFVDAVTLLAWNIAWLAKTQGIDIGAKHWDEICAMGRNLWLLFGPQARMAGRTGSPAPPMHRRGSNSHDPISQTMARTPSGEAARRISLAAGNAAAATGTTTTTGSTSTATAAVPGRLSHNSAGAFLPAARAQGGLGETMRAWPFANPIRLIERIKAALANERMGAEWEVLEKDAWEGHEAAAETMQQDHPSSGTSTPGGGRSAAADALSGAARMRGLLLLGGRIPSSSSDATAATTRSTSSGGGSTPGAAGTTTPADHQRGGWLRVRGHGGGGGSAN